MDIKTKVTALNLEPGSYVVVGSGILQALGIRDTQDIDMVVSPAVFEELKNHGWRLDETGVEVRLLHDVYDAGTIWLSQTVDQVLAKATWIDDVPYANLHEVLRWKKQYRREKDIHDIALIEAYLQSVKK